MKVLISQPMKGYTQEIIRPNRKKLVGKLEKQGYEVVNTIFTEEPPKDSDRAIYYLSKSIEAMSKVDGIVFMKGWEKARGCKIEYYIAQYYNKFIRLEEEYG